MYNRWAYNRWAHNRWAYRYTIDRRTCTIDRHTCTIDRRTCTIDRRTCTIDGRTCTIDGHTIDGRTCTISYREEQQSVIRVISIATGERLIRFLLVINAKLTLVEPSEEGADPRLLKRGGTQTNNRAHMVHHYGTE